MQWKVEAQKEPRCATPACANQDGGTRMATRIRTRKTATATRTVNTAVVVIDRRFNDSCGHRPAHGNLGRALRNLWSGESFRLVCMRGRDTH